MIFWCNPQYSHNFRWKSALFHTKLFLYFTAGKLEVPFIFKRLTIFLLFNGHFFYQNSFLYSEIVWLCVLNVKVTKFHTAVKLAWQKETDRLCRSGCVFTVLQNKQTKKHIQILQFYIIERWAGGGMLSLYFKHFTDSFLSRTTKDV